MIYLTTIFVIIPSVVARWHEIQDGEHYFFHCNNYRNERHQFFEIARHFQSRTINLLLYSEKQLKAI